MDFFTPLSLSLSTESWFQSKHFKAFFDICFPLVHTTPTPTTEKWRKDPYFDVGPWNSFKANIPPKMFQSTKWDCFPIFYFTYCFQHVLFAASCVNHCEHVKLETHFLLLSLLLQLLVFPKISCDLCGTTTLSHEFYVPSSLISHGYRTAIMFRISSQKGLNRQMFGSSSPNTFGLIGFEAKNKLFNRLTWGNVERTAWKRTPKMWESHHE